MSDDLGGPTGPGTNELLEVAYRFGSSVMILATGGAPPRQRLIEAWRQLSRVEGALSGLWPEPRVPADLVEQVQGLLRQLAPDGSIEDAVARMDDVAIVRTCQQITSLAFALHQAVAVAERRPS